MAKTRKIPSLRFHKSLELYYVCLERNRPTYLGADPSKAKREYNRLIAGWLLAANGPAPAGGKAAPAPAATVGHVVDVYDAHAAAYYRTNQLDRVRAALDAVVELYGPRPVAEFDQLALQRVRDHLLRRPSKRGKRDGVAGKPLSRTYVNRLVGCVQTAWGWLEAQTLVPNGASAALRTVKSIRKGHGGAEPPPRTAVPDELVEETMPALNHVVAAMVRLQRLTGLRPGEVCRLRPADLSRHPDRKLVVPETNPPMAVSAFEVAGGQLVWVYVPAGHKTLWRGKRRLVPIGPQAQAVLAPFLDRPPETYCFSPLEAMDALRQKSGRRAVYGRQPGARYTTQTYGRAVTQAVGRINRRRLRAAGGRIEAAQLLPSWSPNLLRKAAATSADDLADRDTTSALLGHSSPDMTSVYAMQALRRAAEFVARHG